MKPCVVYLHFIGLTFDKSVRKHLVPFSERDWRNRAAITALI